MRDIARNFQALPLVSWLVWMAMAVIAAPVMALPVETVLETSQEVTEEVTLAVSTTEEAPSFPLDDGALTVDEALLDADADADADADDDEIDEAVVDGAAEPSTILLAQTSASDLADPADPFIFDETSVEPNDGNVLAPLSDLEPASPENPDGDGLVLDDGPLTPPSLTFQAAAIQTGDEFSARARVQGYYYLEPNVLVGGTVDLTTGQAFSDTNSTGFSISELYVTAAPPNMPNLRGTVGLVELSSYFDRNSFAKDSLTHFINPVFQTNPALAATQLESQPAALVNWRPIDEISLKAAAFSSGGFDDFEFNSLVGELGVSLGNVILRGTYISADDAGNRDGVPESFQINRNGQFGPMDGDREVSYGINGEWFIPELNAGLFGRYGHYDNRDLDISGDTYSFGVNFLDLFIDDDRFGVAYGRGLSNDDLRQGDRPDVLEVVYDVRLAPNVRAAVDWQLRDEFSESVFGFRIRADWDLLEIF